MIDEPRVPPVTVGYKVPSPKGRAPRYGRCQSKDEERDMVGWDARGVEPKGAKPCWKPR